MESREVQGQAAMGRGLQLQEAQYMVIGPTSSYPSNSTLINSNPTANFPPPPAHRFSFNPLTSPPSHNQHHLQQFHHQNQQLLKPLDSLNSVDFDGSPQFQYNTEHAMKKKRGRPRKYAPDGNIALQLAPTTPVANHSPNHGGSDSVGLESVGDAVEQPPKRNRGRPPGSGKRQIDALGGVSGVGFTPHVITVNAGEDVASKITAFSQQGPRAVCILSANGAVCNVTLRQSGGMVKYEGRFEIISLSGSFLVSENNGSCSRSGGLNISLAGSDGQVVGGGVAGTLQAATPVQIIVGSFIADGKKQNLDVLRTGPSYIPTSNLQTFGAPGTAGSSPSHAGSSKSSDENGGSPLNGGSGFHNNLAPPSMHDNNMQMQMNSLWPGHTKQ
ncbi:AT-hook motif nuclear-localized protein 8 [Hibiscus syriacus]|uniref:AT-hook motif nuclear-localized protein n=1 Tax=Hibiscus syriacus TaxID=106335 RepID=A0A6A2YJJ7_HIBSY|nr:AT-hook motif nuclear-localized protein 13-like [Hibiscus syriacus]KAE8677557.1 AT-hook motif nuclear-localized protein 8 [Hibiscus syriacus]